MRIPPCALMRAFPVAVALVLSVSLFSQSQIQVGFTILNADPGSLAPVGSALFTYTNPSGILVSQAGVAGVVPFNSGRIFVDQAGTFTGLALANPSSSSASISLSLRDPSGSELLQSSLSLPPHQHTAVYVHQLFPNLPDNFTGSLSFSSNQPLAAITLRESRNAYNEPLYTTLPVINLSSPPSSLPLVFPQIAAGDGYSTQLVLLNTSSSPASGSISFTDSSGNPLTLRLNNSSASSFPYLISPNGTFKATLDSPSSLTVGYATVSPDPSSPSPSGTAIFQFFHNNSIVTEAGVAASPPTSNARIFVDNIDTFTGLALANTSSQTAPVRFLLLDRFGNLISSSSRPMPPHGHIAIFAHQLFPNLPSSFSGLIEFDSPFPLAPITLKLTINSRLDQVLTTLPVADLNNPPTASSIVFPQIASGQGFSTRLILINTSKSSPAPGSLSFLLSNGLPMTLPMAGSSNSSFSFLLPPAAARQLQPGNPIPASSLLLLDSYSNSPTSEFVLNEGSSSQLSLLVIDASGQIRDDFDFSCSSKDPAIASIDSFGYLRAFKTGFSSLAFAAGGAVSSATATVVSVSSGPQGFQISGIAQDLSRRLYLSNSSLHTILLSQNINQSPSTYAGVSNSPGLDNDLRLLSRFNNPSFLAFDQALGSLFVSDSSNHSIRRISPSPNGRTSTLAGSGSPGRLDGPSNQASFNNPQGIALDNRGFLWVSDSSNHSIRRINLLNGSVSTVAGSPGSPGNSDGTGSQARFNSPAGIAVEPESIAQQLERQISGAPPPPVSVIVADRGNNSLRRVTESGEVTTIRPPSQTTTALNPRSLRVKQNDPSPPLPFSSPTGVAIDPAGNIYVTEPDSAGVKTLLRSGSLVSMNPASTFLGPKGIVAAEGGKVVVSDSNNAAKEIRFGTPQVTSVSPSKVSLQGGEKVTVRGSNFAPETLVAIAGIQVTDVEVRDSQTITFVTSALPSGLSTLTIQNRGGIAQTSLYVEPVALKDLAAGQITTVAGGSSFAGDGGRAESAWLFYPAKVAMDNDGNLYIADTYHHRIRRVSASTGIITTVAGTGFVDGSGDGGPAVLAGLAFPFGIAVDSANGLLIVDTLTSRIRRVDADTGVITTVAGNGTDGYTGNGGPARSASLTAPYAVVADASGSFFIADTGNNCIRKVEAGTGVITTVAGNGTAGYSGDGGPAANATMSEPCGLALDAEGNLFIADTGNYRVRRVDASTQIIRTVAGNGILGVYGDGGPASAANLARPYGVALGSNGDLLVVDTGSNRVRKVDAATGIIQTVVGNGYPGYSGDGGSAISAQLMAPTGIVVDGAGNYYIADFFNHRVRRVAAATGIISTMVGVGTQGLSGDNGPAGAAQLMGPYGTAVDTAGNVYIADTFNNRIRKIEALTGIIRTVAGTGALGYSGDNGPAKAAGLSMPEAVVSDPSGNLFVCDTANHRIRRIDAVNGIITTVAGNGNQGYSGDNGPGTSASLNVPTGLAFDTAGNLLIADSGNHRVRRLSLSGGVIDTVAGDGNGGFSGDNAPAASASLLEPAGIAVDSAGNLYIADTRNQRIRKVAASNGLITTVAGTGQPGYSGDGGPAVSASLEGPKGVAVDARGNLFIADTLNARIRRVAAGTGVITTVGGPGKWGDFGDGGPATAAFLTIPTGITVDSAGNVFIPDTGNYRIRAIRGPIP